MSMGYYFFIRDRGIMRSIRMLTVFLLILFCMLFGFTVYKHYFVKAASATIRQEINILDGTLAVSSTSGAIVQLDTNKYSGTVSYYFEVVTAGASASTDSVTLTRSGTTTNDASISLAGTAANIRVRSAAFTPPAGATQYVVKTGANHSIKAARIIVIQTSNPISSTETQIEIGNQETGKVNTVAAPLTAPKYWKYTAANWDTGILFNAEVTKAQSGSNFSTTITLQQDDGSFGTWTDIATIANADTTAAATRFRVSFTPTDGRNYRISAVESASSGGKNYSIYNAKIVADSDGYAGTNYTSLSLASNVNGGQSGDSSYQYYLTGTNLVRVLKSDFSTTNTLNIGCAGVFTTNDSNYIYVGCPNTLKRINKSDFSTTASLTVTNITYPIENDGTYIFARISSTFPATIDRINISDFSTITSITLPNNHNQTPSFGFDSTYLYVCTQDNFGNGIVDRIAKSTFASVSSYTFSTAYCAGLTNDNNNIYVVDPTNFYIISESSFTTIGTISSFSIINYNFGYNEHRMVAANGYVYVVSTSYNIYRVDPQSMSITGIKGNNTTTSLSPSDMSVDNNNIYTSDYDSSDANANIVTKIPLVGQLPTKVETQYMLSNTAGSVTGLQGFPTKWDSTEWSGVINSYKHAIDSTNATSSAKLQDIDNANTDVTGSTATGNNQVFSSALTMPTSGHQIDTNITAGATTVTADRIIVSVLLSGNASPNAPTLSTPASGATNVSLTPSFTLSTTDPEGEAVKYRLYLYQSDCSTAVGGSPFSQSVSGTGWNNGTTAYTSGATATYTYQGTLADNTTYCWKADAIDPAGSNSYGTASSTRLFTTRAITLTQNHYRWRNDDGYEAGGNVSAGIVRPNADATVAWGVTGSATHFGALAAAGDTVTQPTAGSTAEFVSSATASQTDTYDMGTLSGSGSYNEVDVWVYAKAATNDKLGVSTNIAGTTQQTVTLTTSNAWYKVAFTGLSMTQTDLDGLRITFTQVKNGGSDTVTVNTMYAEVFNSLTAATYMAAQDTVVSNVSTGVNIRLRFEVANTDTQSGSPNLSLEYAAKSGTCSASTYSTIPTTSGSATQMGTSTYFATGDATTTQLTATGTFTAGKMVESASTSTGALSIPASNYTEVEFVFQGNASAAGNTYCFRLTNNGTALSTYSVYPEITFTGGVSPPTTDQFMRGGRYFSSGSEQPYYWAQ